jgi:hypothetical protein
MEQNEVTTETKMVLIQRERQLWLNTREMMTMRFRVQKRLNSKEGMETCEKELTNVELALDELDKILAELQSEKK